MRLRVETVADWERIVFNPTGPERGVEGQRLDLKREITDNEKDIALPIAAFANADGGVIAYGANESDIDGVRMASGTNDLGVTQTVARRIEDVARQYLWGMDAAPIILRPLQLVNGDRVIACNVPPSVGLVACCLPNEREKLRYPVRTGENTNYLRPSDVELRMHTYSDRAMRLRLEDFLGQVPAHVTLVHVPNQMPTDLEGGVTSVVEDLLPHAIRVKLVRSVPHSQIAHLDVPYDWVRRMWAQVEPHAVKRILIAGAVAFDPPDRGASHVRLLARSWQ